MKILLYSEGGNMNSEDIAYLAGVIDGEGSIGIGMKTATNSYHLMIQVSMKMPTLVPKWIFETFGGHYGEYAQGKNAWGEGMIAKWSIHGTEAQGLLKLIVDILKDKKERAEVAIVFPISSKGSRSVDTEMQDFCYTKMRGIQGTKAGYQDEDIITFRRR